MIGGRFGKLAMNAYFAGQFATFIYLMFFDGYAYTWWNWFFAIGANFPRCAPRLPESSAPTPRQGKAEHR